MATLTFQNLRKLTLDSGTNIVIPFFTCDTNPSRDVLNIILPSGFHIEGSVPCLYLNANLGNIVSTDTSTGTLIDKKTVGSTVLNLYLRVKFPWQYSYFGSNYPNWGAYQSNYNSYTHADQNGLPFFVLCPNNNYYLVDTAYFNANATLEADNDCVMGGALPEINKWGYLTIDTTKQKNITCYAYSDPTTIKTIFDNSEEWSVPTDPYSGAGDSDTGGGGGTFDGSSDAVPVPALPSVGATNTGFISLFVPTQAQLKQVADYLWSGLFDLSTYLKIFENPMDCILGLSVVPVTIPTSGSAQITVGNIELSGISLPLATQQYVEVDCGSIPFTDKFFGSYLDQDPYTKMALFVPYSGVHSIKADDVMGKTVNLKYHIDILTGSLVAFLTCGDSVLYEFNGACASNIPVNSMNYASTIENAIRIAVNIGTTVATAGASAPLTGANKAARESARTFGTAVNMAGSTAEGILSLKPNIDRAGSLGGTTGLMGNQTPYFIITRPRLCKPANQNTFKGYPSFIQVTISDLIGEGYTEFDTVVLAGLYLTDGEKEELKQILESGVYL